MHAWVRANYLGAEQCAHCNGSGRGFIFKCKACGGSGTIPVVKCPRCRGAGKGWLCRCRLCGGEKTVAGWRPLKRHFGVV